MSLNESTVEAAALEWFTTLGYAVGHESQLAPGEAAAEPDSFGDVVLVERLRAAIARLNPYCVRPRQELKFEQEWEAWTDQNGRGRV